jgi:hypothetical protein
MERRETWWISGFKREDLRCFQAELRLDELNLR